MHTIKKSRKSDLNAGPDEFDVGYLQRVSYGDAPLDEFVPVFTRLSFRAALAVASHMNGGTMPELNYTSLKERAQ